MKKKALICALVMTCGLTAVSAAHATDTHVVTSKASPDKAGSTAKPAAFTPSFTYAASDVTGVRATTPDTWTWKWNGVTTNTAAKFPTCTAAQIDAAQSDSVCPKGSLVAEGTFVAKLGPEGNKTSSIDCSGKRNLIYNAGKNKQIYYVSGPGTSCAGVGYIPPIPLSLKTSGGTTTTTLVFPANLVHPLPGVEGSLSAISFTFKKLSIKVKGKTVPYMQSTSCAGGKRTFTFGIKDPLGAHTATAAMGTCSK